MSFSSDVKNEVARLSIENKCCLKIELFALLLMGGRIIIKNFFMGMDFSTENAALARRVLQLIKKNFSVPVEVSATRSKRLKKTNRYLVRLSPSKEVQAVMLELGIVGEKMDLALDKKFLPTVCCKEAFLRGVFLAGGSVSKPSGDYHLEIVSQSQELAVFTLKVLKGFSIVGKLTDRKGDYIVYLKGADSIIRFLTIIKAHGALLEFENVRVIKDMRNHVNRVVNCETANLGKTVQAALKQIEAIGYIDEHLGLLKLPPNLKKVAQLRLDNPDLSLLELAELSGDDIGKAGMNHRFRKILQIAKSLGMKE